MNDDHEPRHAARVDDVAAADSGEILRGVSGSVADVLGMSIGEIAPGSVLLDLGADSFHFIDLALRLEQQFGVRLPRTYATPGTHTVAALVRAVTLGLAVKNGTRV